MKLSSIMKPRKPILDSGSYLSVCVGVIAIGEQYVDRSAFGGKSDYERQLTFVFEYPSELDDDGKPKQLSKDVNATNSSRGTLAKIMADWNGREYTKEELAAFDFDELLGKACQNTVLVTDSGYSRITGISAIPKGVPVPSATVPFISFSVYEWDDEAFAKLPEWAQNKIKNSVEYQKMHAPDTVVEVKAPEVGTVGSVTAAAEAGCPI